MKGQSLIELAISFVVLLILLSGAVEFGMAFFQFVQLRDAAQEGALYGSVCECDINQVETRARGASSSPINLSDPSVVVSIKVFSGVNEKPFKFRCEGDALQVNLSFEHKIFMPFLAAMLGRETITLNAQVIDTVLVPTC